MSVDQEARLERWIQAGRQQAELTRRLRVHATDEDSAIFVEVVRRHYYPRWQNAHVKADQAATIDICAAYLDNLNI